MKLNIDGHIFEVTIKPGRDSYEVTISGEKIKTAKVSTSVEGPLIHTDRNTYEVRTATDDDGTSRITIGQETYCVEKAYDNQEDSRFLRSPMQGIITAVKVPEGAAVKKGQTIIKLMSMKMENEIRSQKDAKVKHVNTKKNQTVSKGDVLIEFE